MPTRSSPRLRRRTRGSVSGNGASAAANTPSAAAIEHNEEHGEQDAAADADVSSGAKLPPSKRRKVATRPGSENGGDEGNTASHSAPASKRGTASAASKQGKEDDSGDEEESDDPNDADFDLKEAEEEAKREAAKLAQQDSGHRQFKTRSDKLNKQLTFQDKLLKLNTLLTKAEQYSKFLAKRHEESVSGQRGEGNSNLVFRQPDIMTGGSEKLRLRDYQLHGAQWLEGLYFNGLHGILADEMGLGKTIQVIAVIAHLKSHGVAGPFLVVAPLSTLRNWINEFKRWCPSISTLLYHGSKAEREELRMNRMGMTRSRNGVSRRHTSGKVSADFPVIVTSYDILMRDIGNFRQFLWEYLVVDEGHRLKNKDCRLMRELKSLKTNQRLLLTGTPLQNNLSELWSLLNFLMPDAFNDLQFFQAWFGWDSRDEDAMTEKIKGGARSHDIVGKLHRILAPFMMRRLKEQVCTELPAKKEIVVYVGMTAAQKDLYDRIVGDMAALSRTLQQVAKMRGLGSQKGLLNRLMQLRKCCNHPYLFADNEETNEELVQMSGKLVLLDKLMRNFYANGHKVLIFSQFTTMLDIIQDYFWLRKQDKHVCRIDGSVKLDERQEQIDAFNREGSNKCVFLLSTRAGGVGINLASADTVIIFDSDWNPHMDNQAQDRAHRIGQKKDVFVYRLVTEGSVELKVLERANAKRSLERLTMAGNFGSMSAKRSAKMKKSMQVEIVEELLSKDINVSDAQRSGKTGGITDRELSLILDRERVMGRSGDGNGIPNKGRGYEIVEHHASSLVGAVEHVNTAASKGGD